MRRLLTVLVVGLVLGWPGAAFAAPHLESSTPGSGDSVPAGGPVELVLRFTEPLDTDSATLVLRDDGGHDRVTATTQVEGATLHALMPEVPPGDYVGRYTVWTASGSKLTGSLPFTISAPEVVFTAITLPAWVPTALVVAAVGIAAAAMVGIAARR